MGIDKLFSSSRIPESSHTRSDGEDPLETPASIFMAETEAIIQTETPSKPSPFTLRWIHGYNQKVGIINLNNKGSTTVFYAACNCGVLYNWSTNQMKILQGHRNFVTSIAADRRGDWLVTADSGPENILTIWNAEFCIPCRTLFSPHGHLKIGAVALSCDAKYLLTIAYSDKAILYWWIWSHGMELPHAKVEVEMNRDIVIVSTFNPENTEQFVMMTKHNVYIGAASKLVTDDRFKDDNDNEDKYELNVFKPEKKVCSEMGSFTSFTFVPTTAQILVGTSRGAIAIYGYTIEYTVNANSSNIQNLRFVKYLKVEKHRINVIKYMDDVVIIGNQVGELRFYDDQLKLLYWVRGFQVDCIKGISFNLSPRSYSILDPICMKYCECVEKSGPDVNPFTGDVHQKLVKRKIPSDATIKHKPFVVRDFLLSTDNQGIGFVDFVSEKYKTILDFRKSNVSAMAVHSEKPLLCLGYFDGTVEIVNFEEHKVFAKLYLRDRFKIVIPPKDDSINSKFQITLPTISVTCLKYSPSGMHLACGLNDGQILFLDPTTIQLVTETPLKDTSHGIREMCYSCDSMTMAFADICKTVGVYKYNCDRKEWIFVGKHRAHNKGIISLLFTTKKNPNGYYKLFSFGEGKIMVEYDIGASTNECLAVYSLDRVEESAVPLYAIEWPIPDGIESELLTILICNDQYKYKIINCDTAMTLATFLGPRYEGPVNRLILVTKKEHGEDIKYLLFATKNTIGLQKLILDGNPYKHVGLLCHPKEITNMQIRDDLETLFTSGDKDSSVGQWTANYNSVEITTNQGGEDLEPYYCLIDGGKPGWLFLEMRDMFYYIQILCQGTFAPATRRVGDFIPIDSLPDIVRSLGFFPSQFEVENLLIEAKYKIYENIPEALIGFDDFVRLYLNHRPAFGENISMLKNAFRTFASFQKDKYVLSREDFVDVLSSYGECFSKELSWYLLSILCGLSFDDRALMQAEDFSFLPDEISFADFTSNLLGIQDKDNMSEEQSAISSMVSHRSGSSITTQSSDR